MFIAPIQVQMLLAVCCQCPMLRAPLQHITVAELPRGWQLHVPCRQNSKNFRFRSKKSYSAIPLFHIPRFTDSLSHATDIPVVAAFVSEIDNGGGL